MTCYYCERKFGEVTHNFGKPLLKTKDHIYPVSKGGFRHKLNLIDACQYCNSLKGDMELYEFLEYLDKRISGEAKVKHKFKDVLPTIRNNVFSLINKNKQMPKFIKPESPKVKWTAERVQEQIDLIDFDIKEMQREINKLQSRVGEIFEKRRVLGNKISDKVRYKGQLCNQLRELLNEEPKPEVSDTTDVDSSTDPDKQSPQ
jgi:hypothetical protein